MPNISFLTKDSCVYFATFSYYQKGKRTPVNGMVAPILAYFMPKISSLILLDQPHVASDTIDPIIERYRNGKQIGSSIFSPLWYLPIYLLCRVSSDRPTRVTYKIRDLLATLITAFGCKRPIDLFIGLEAVNALAGLILRKIGMVKTVVYYVSDYSPVRFGNSIFNKIYILLDRFCVTNADFTWDVSPAMKEGRFKAGMSYERMSRILHVENALFPEQIKSVSLLKRNRNRLVYVGSLDSDFGIDLAIKALKRIIVTIPSTTLHIIGGGNNLTYCKTLVEKLQLKQSVFFYGIVPDNNDMAKIVRESYIGLAPYRSFPDSVRWYGDAGKIRQYTASGLPVVTTHVPPFGRYIVKNGAGVMTKDTVKSFSDGIIRLLSNDALYKDLTSAAIRISKNNIWEKVYTRALYSMEKMSQNGTKRH